MNLGTLFVKLAADTTSFTAGLRNAAEAVTEAGADVAGLGKAAAAATVPLAKVASASVKASEGVGAVATGAQRTTTTLHAASAAADKLAKKLIGVRTASTGAAAGARVPGVGAGTPAPAAAAPALAQVPALTATVAGLGAELDKVAAKQKGWGVTAAEATEKVSKKLSEATQKIAGMGVAWAAMAGGALIVAGQHSATVAQELANLKGSFARLAVDLSGMLLPAVRAVADVFLALAAALRSLDPDTKAMIANVIKWTAALTALAVVVGKVSGLIGALSGIAALVIANPATVAIVVGIAAAIGAIAYAVASATGHLQKFYDLWDKIKGGGSGGALLPKLSRGELLEQEENRISRQTELDERLEMYDAVERWDARHNATTQGRGRDGRLRVGLGSMDPNAMGSDMARRLANAPPLSSRAPQIDLARGLTATVVPKFVTDLRDGAAKAGQLLGNALIQQSGKFGTVVTGVMEGFAAGGPIGAIMGGMAALLSSSVEFQALGEGLNSITGVLADTVGPLFAKAMEFLFEVIKAVAWISLNIAMELNKLWSTFTKAMAEVVDSIPKNTMMHGGLTWGQISAGWSDELRGASRAASVIVESLAATIQELEGVTWEEALAKAKAARATEDLAKAASRAAGEINGVSWYKVATQVFGSAMLPIQEEQQRASDMVYGGMKGVDPGTASGKGVTLPLAPPPPPAPPPVHVDVQINGDLASLISALEAKVRDGSYRQSGSTVVLRAAVAGF